MKRKKPLCTLLVAMLVLSVGTVSVSAGPLPKLFVDPPTYYATVLGEIFTIDINIFNVSSLGGFEFHLGYNTTLLDALDAVVGPFPPNPDLITLVMNDSEGYVEMDVLCAPPANGNGTLATITFNVTYAGAASCTLDLYNTVIGDWVGNPVEHEVEDGNYEFAILSITVATDKPSYFFGEKVKIHGNVTLDGSPYEGLVSIEVDTPGNRPLVMRTVQMGTTPPPGDIKVLDLYPCNEWGEPKASFGRGTKAYFNATAKNNGTEWKTVTLTVNAYDENMVPLLPATSLYKAPLGPGYTATLIASIYIPYWAYVGTGTVYACVLTDYPRNGGTPYCPEKSATFQITTGGGGGAGIPGTQGSGNNSTSGNYSLTFKPPVYEGAIGAGNYTVYASSRYLNQEVVSSTTFPVPTEFNYDVNFDGKVNILDVKLVKLAISGLIELPPADVNGDGKINVLDLKLVKLAASGMLG